MDSDVSQQTQVSSSPNPAHLNIAHRDKRVYDALIDGIFISVILYTFYNYSFAGLPGERWPPLYKDIFSSYITVFIYYFIFEFLYHKTPGKFIMKTRVVTQNGGPLTYKHILIRNLVRLIPFEWVSFYPDLHPIGWHDQFAKTIVIDENVNPVKNKYLDTARKAAKIILYIVVALLLLLILFFGGVIIYRVFVLQNLQLQP